jgi:hypothetical protein
MNNFTLLDSLHKLNRVHSTFVNTSCPLCSNSTVSATYLLLPCLCSLITISGHRNRGRYRRHQYSGIYHLQSGVVAFRRGGTLLYRIGVPVFRNRLGYPYSGTGLDTAWTFFLGELDAAQSCIPAFLKILPKVAQEGCRELADKECLVGLCRV